MAVRAFAHQDLKWTDANKAGIRLQPVRADRDNGLYLGFLAFDAMATTGIHQHTGPAFSYFLHGGLADYQGAARAGVMGINLDGSTHDAIALAPTLLAARLEAPVLYPDEGATQGEAIHTGARGGAIVNRRPEVLPDLNVPVEELAWDGTTVAGLQRRMVFDYAGTGLARRCVQLRLLPGTKVGPFRASGLIDIYVVGGDLSAGHECARSGDFMVMDADAVCALETHYGCLAFFWLEGPAVCVETGASLLAPF
jgi:anti-sigma factor ChrR (cupin superfamily)